MLPSIIWATKPAETVVRSMGKLPENLLREFNASSAADAKVSLRILTAQSVRYHHATLTSMHFPRFFITSNGDVNIVVHLPVVFSRSIIAGFVGITQV
jgi:hypothetical protein